MDNRILFSTAAAVAAASLALWVPLHIARTLVTPVEQRPERIRVMAASDGTVTLVADRDTAAPGVFSLFWDKRTGHARIGPVVSEDRKAGTVTRRVEAVNSGELTPGTRGYWSGYVYPDPEAAGLPFEDVTLPGPAPAWLIPGADQGLWVIHIHGLGGRRTTGLRTAPFFHRRGISQLLISFRGDGDAPPTPDGKHHLGASEQADVEAALAFAAGRGAASVILSGWSLGATMALAAAHTSEHRDLISGLVLTAPVLDWHRTLLANSAAARLPAAFVIGAWRVLGGPLHRLVGLNQPLDLRALDFTQVPPPLPVIILHGGDDARTPIRISEEVTARFPDSVSLVRFPACRHTQEWNSWPGLWEESVDAWLDNNAGSLKAPFGPPDGH
ncbi:alpha/beta hydrolase [Arthrobacter sp. S39]|uniref:alpha/beta hydrolase family protein n=1 Tax=Arthrobacter sp. S39 TaxID=2509720 RepID=UPI001037DBCD|nr:alpha/beta hydrolase [Arthrobacter sp. S39]TAP45104.1 lipase [Arthrobacter sp. S39]